MGNRFKSWIGPWIPPRALGLYRKHFRRAVSGGKEPVHESSPCLLPERLPEKLFPGIDSSVIQIPSSIIVAREEWTLSIRELITLAAIARQRRPANIFEFGTYRGGTTLAMAMNTESETNILTLDLAPSQKDTHRHGLGVGGFPKYTVGELFRKTPQAEKIRQLLGNSQTFDYSPYYGTIDMVFIDADHSYEFVKHDSQTAFRLLKPGGVIVWDDYVWDERHPECAGVARCLNELFATRHLARISATRLAIYMDKSSHRHGKS